MATETSKQPTQNSADDWANSVPDEPSSLNSGQDGGNYPPNSRPMGRGYRGGQDRGFDSRDNRQYGGNSRGYDQDRGFDNSRDYRQYGGRSRGFDQNRRYDDRQDNRQPWRNKNFDQDGARNWDNPRSDRGGSRGFHQSNNYRGNQSGRGRSRGYDQEYAKGPHKNPEGRWSNDRDYNGRDYNGRGSYERSSYDRGSYNYNQKMDDTSISRALSNILRHSAEKVGLELDRNGYVFVEDLLKLKRFGGVTVDDLRRVVNENDKQRFKMETDESTQKVKIRANQGHSQKFQQLDLDHTPIDDPKKYPIVIHGTYYSSWESIRKEGLKRMKRIHIHFAPGLPGEDGVISGMRTSCEVLIYIDLEKALKDGLKFFISTNQVILSCGDKDGVIAPKYFLRAVDRTLGNVLSLEESIPFKKRIPVGMTVVDQPKDKGANKKQKKNKKDKHQEKYTTEMEDTTNNQDAKDSANEKKSENSPAEVKAATEEAEKPEKQVAEKTGEELAEKTEEGATGGAEEEETKKSKGKGAEKKGKGTEKPKEKDEKSPFKNTFEKTKNAVKKFTDDAAGEEKVSSSKENENSKKNSKTKTPPPVVHLIKDVEDGKLDELKKAPVLAVHALKKKDDIVYVLISQPGAVFVFNPITMMEVLKPLLENEKCLKVMFDHSLNDEMSKQLEIEMYDKPVVDIQVLFSMKKKRKLALFSEIIGEECVKLSQPTEGDIIEEVSEHTSEKSKHVKKIITQVAQLVPLYDKYKAILDSEDDTSPDNYKLDDNTMAKINKIFGENKTVVDGVSG